MSSLDVRAIDETDLRSVPAPAAKQDYRVFLSEEAFDRAVERGTADVGREIGGVLVGELLKDAAGPYLKIDTTIDALHAEEKGAELTFTHATWEHINKEMDSKHAGKRVVGWYHTHPGFGVFLSDRDQFIHKSFFNLPFQVAFVYDPKSREHGMFTWRDNEVPRARRYWIGAREQLWDGARQADLAKLEVRKSETDKAPGEREREREREDTDRDSLGLNGSIGMLAVIGLILLILGGLIGRWWGQANAGEIVAQAQLAVEQSKQQGAQAAIAGLQSQLVDVLRDSLGDQATRGPVIQAINDLDATIAMLQGGPVPTSAPTPAPAAGSGSGSAAPPPAPAAPVAPDPRLAAITARLITTRQQLVELAQSRQQAQNVLRALGQAARQGGEIRADLAHDVAEERAGLGLVYSELAADAIKAGDKARVYRLLASAAHLDPGNFSRYERQLQAFDKTASLPRNSFAGDDVSPDHQDVGSAAAGSGSAGSGSAASTGSGSGSGATGAGSGTTKPAMLPGVVK